MTADSFRALTGVSRETLQRLKIYADELQRWGRRINLVGRATLADVWRRHMLDSARLYPLLPDPCLEGPLLDLGSGAGFPGLALAIMGAPDVHLVEADARKSVFLREVARLTGTQVAIHEQRIEHLTPFRVRTVTARALAPLEILLRLAHPFADAETVCLFPKGAGGGGELARAAQSWSLEADCHPAAVGACGEEAVEGCILRLRRFAPR